MAVIPKVINPSVTDADSPDSGGGNSVADL
jgi:hypothetical protein